MLTAVLYGLFVTYDLTDASSSSTRRLLQNYPPPPANYGVDPISYGVTMPGMNLPPNPPAVMYPIYSVPATPATSASPVNPFFVNADPSTTQAAASPQQPAVPAPAVQNPFFPSASTTTTTTSAPATTATTTTASPATTTTTAAPATTETPQQMPTEPGLQIPLYSVPAPSQTELDCVVAQGMFGSCANTVQTPANIANQWKMSCANLGACYGTTLNLQIGQYGQTTPTYVGITELYGLWFTEQNAGAYATMNLYNFQGGSAVKVQRIECGDSGACYNTKFNLYNVDIGDFVCSPLSACQGCTITDWTIPNAPMTTTCLEIA